MSSPPTRPVWVIRPLPDMRGFTLIEIMVVIFIMVMALSITIPAIYTALNKTRMKSFIRQSASSLRAARSDAIATKSAVDVIIDLDRDTLTIVNKGRVSSQKRETAGESADVLEDDNREPTYPPDPDEIDKQEKNHSIVGFRRFSEEKMIEEGAVRIRFFPSGSCDGGEIYITGSQENVYFVVRLDPITGHVSVQQERSLLR